MSNLNFSRRQLFKGGFATLFAEKLGAISALGCADVSLVPTPLGRFNPFSVESTDTLTKMIVDLMDDESMHPKHLARSAVRIILNEAAQPGADAKQVIAKYFPDETVKSLSKPGNLFPGPSTICSSHDANDDGYSECLDAHEFEIVDEAVEYRQPSHREFLDDFVRAVK